jgi:hypothetical protein
MEHQAVVVMDFPAQCLHELIVFLPQHSHRQIGQLAPSCSPATSPFSINRPDTPNTSVATLLNLIFASSRTF